MSNFSDLADALEKLTGAAERLDQIERVADAVERLADEQRGQAVAEADDLKPDRRYNYGAVADFLGMARSTVRGISREELPRCRDGYVRGVDVMAYLGEITHAEAAAYKKHRRQRVVSRIPASSRRAEA